jgi:hypothetical protein
MRVHRTLLLGLLLGLGCGDKSLKPSALPGDAGAVVDAAADSGTGSDGTPCGEAACYGVAACANEPSPHCVCPSGYDDSSGDGSQCDDIDECTDGSQPCDPHASCKNQPGGYACECSAPAYIGDGEHCACADNYLRTRDGLCLAQDGQACGDDVDCLNNHCEGGTCCAHACNQPGDCHDIDGARCDDGSTCSYPLLADDTSCDDAQACSAESTCRDGVCTPLTSLDCDDKNPCTDDTCGEPAGCLTTNNTRSCDDDDACTERDFCIAGSCTGTPKDCSGLSDACNRGECQRPSGACKAIPLAQSVGCDDANSCTSLDQCNAGRCGGSGDACGPNASACSAGNPNQCTCKSGFLDDGSGLCVPMNNECASANPCSPDATCFDTSNTDGDAICTCNQGYSGNGAQCQAVDVCHDNPCGDGRGTCKPGAAGTYSCACNDGYKANKTTCACDLTGTFAVRTRLDLSWDEVPGSIEGGSDTTYSYAIEKHSYDASGNLVLDLTTCGDTPIDLCGLGVAPVVAAEAYAQYQPTYIWTLPSIPEVSARAHPTDALPGSAFATDNVAMLMGISLKDPNGAWPSGRAEISGSPAFGGTATNGAAWRDHDSDTIIGLTSYVVPPGGIKADGIDPDPPRDFGATSPVCPRSGGPHTPYAYWPAAREGLLQSPYRITRLYTASRVISAYQGSIQTCDLISGEVIGPEDGKVKLDGRVGGCIRNNGATETACTSSIVDSFDSAVISERVTGASFQIKRSPTTQLTCAMVRAIDFD